MSKGCQKDRNTGRQTDRKTERLFSVVIKTKVVQNVYQEGKWKLVGCPAALLVLMSMDEEEAVQKKSYQKKTCSECQQDDRKTCRQTDEKTDSLVSFIGINTEPNNLAICPLSGRF